MKRSILLFLFALMSVIGGAAQTIGNGYDNGPNLPTHCSPTASTGALFFKTTAPIGLQQCIATDTYVAVGGGSGVPTSAAKVDIMDASTGCTAAGGSSTTYSCSLSPAISAYVTNIRYRFKADVANTAASTINFNGVGAVTIKKAAGGVTTDLAANDIRAGQEVDLVYDGTNMQMQSLLGNVPSAAAAGSSTWIQFNSGGSLSAVAGATIDTTANVSAASHAFAVFDQTYTAGSSSFSGHTIDSNCTSNMSTALNTLSCLYATLQNKATIGKLGHGAGLVIRYSDSSTGGVGIWDGVYIETNTAAGTTATGTIDEANNINIANGTLQSTSQVITLFNGLKFVQPTLVTTTIGKQLTLNLGAVPATDAKLTTVHQIDTGCTENSVYISGCIANARWDFLAPVLIKGMTLGAASVAPHTEVQPYALSFSNFHDTGTTNQLDMLFTTDNGATGTARNIRSVLDIGGSSGTMTTGDSGFFSITASGGGTGTCTTCNWIEIASPTGGGVITTGNGILINPIQTGPVAAGFAIKQTGTSDTVEFDGQTKLGASGTKILAHYSNSATLDFASVTGPNCAADLTITVTGATVGDTVEIATPAAIVTAGQFFGWVSASNTVSLRYCLLTGTQDPASGTFRADVWHH